MATSLFRHAIGVFAIIPVVCAVPYSEYILAPSSRTVVPPTIHHANGSVTNTMGLTLSGTGTTTLSGESAITYDFTKNIGGLVSFVVKSVNGTGNFIGVSFTESSFWISPHGSDATQNVGIDETLWYAVNEPGHYSVGQPAQNAPDSSIKYTDNTCHLQIRVIREAASGT